MNKTQKKQLENFYKVYEQLYHDYAITNNEIAQKTGIHRSSVSRYRGIMHGMP
ncbi:MAG: hypothetical protein PVF58_03225 [Candidatus Methanofastidiosia archaeon]|jgi:hypothetical protein